MAFIRHLSETTSESEDAVPGHRPTDNPDIQAATSTGSNHHHLANSSGTQAATSTGPGHHLTNSPSTRAATSSRSGHRFTNSSSTQAATSAQLPLSPPPLPLPPSSVLDPSQSRHPPMEAAQARPNNVQQTINVTQSAENLKPQAKREMEQDRTDQGDNTRNQAPESVEKQDGKTPMVQGIYFSCKVLGPETGSYDHIRQKIKDYLYSQLTEKPILAPILILYSCNDEAKMVQTGLKTLSFYLENIMTYPGDENYTKIRLSNENFQKKVGCLSGALLFLQAAGFDQMELPNPEGELEPYLVFRGDKDPNKLQYLIDLLSSQEPILPQLDRNCQVLAPAVAKSRLELPDDFFEFTLEEIRRRFADLKREAEQATQMRTTAQREQDRIPHPKQKSTYAIIRIRLPDSNLLQGTFYATERLEDVEDFVRSHLADPQLQFLLIEPPRRRLAREETLDALDLAPRAVLTLQTRHPAATPGSSLLKLKTLALLHPASAS